MDLIEHIKNNTIDYQKIKEDSVILVRDSEEDFDINFIITVRGRLNFSEPMYKSFLEASKKTDLKISYTVVEHSENPEHSKFCKKNNTNYIWIKSKSGELFNKCLSYNMGVFFGPKSKSLIFHDIDCLIQSDFFNKLSENIDNKKCRAIQCFTGRRVLYISEQFTPKVISGEVSVDELSLDMPEIDLPRLGGKVMIGAPGGSIFVDRDLFFEVGGYDADLFLANSPEDAFFWEKIDTVDKMEISDNPEIEVYHMYHPPTWMNNPHIKNMENILNIFKNKSPREKGEIINFMNQKISNLK